MRCHLLIIAFFLSLSSLLAQTSVIINDSTMFIGQEVDSLTEEERYFNPIYLIVQQGQEHLKEQIIHGSVCDCDTALPNRRIGIFSVAPNRYVSFSQGNLQFFPSSNAWKFADSQYDYLGNANKYFSPDFRNWVDLLDWSTSEQGDFLDWGNNKICGDAPNTWRTLSKDEWKYILHDRTDAMRLLAYAKINGNKGIMILPDNWKKPDNIKVVSIQDDGFTWDNTTNVYTQPSPFYNLYTLQEWELLEATGAVFLPAAGFIHNTLQKTGSTGRYWSSSQHPKTKAYYTSFGLGAIRTQSAVNNDEGHSVRLVHDTIPPKIEHEHVDLGLSVKWATVNVGASCPEDYGDYFAWGETEPKDIYSWENYKWCNGTSSNMTRYNATDGMTTLALEDDAAYVNWGEKWRMPSAEEMQELLEGCTWTWTTKNGINGYLVTSQKAGYTDQSIFLPASGYRNDNSLHHINSHGDYWTSSRNSSVAYSTIHLLFLPDKIIRSTSYRNYGFPIRPVYDEDVYTKQYYYGITNEQFEVATSTWNTSSVGYALVDQSYIKGKKLYGIRLNVKTAGSVNLYKVPSLEEQTEENFEYITTITTTTVGLQDIDFDFPIHLGENEYLVLGKPSEKPSMVCYYALSSLPLQYYVYKLGSKGVHWKDTALLIDFY